MVSDPKRQSLIDNKVSDNLLAFCFTAQSIMVVSVDLENYSFGISLMFFNNKIHFEVIDSHLAMQRVS